MKWTNPKPLDRPESQSVTTWQSFTTPYREKKACNSCDVVFHGRLRTVILQFTGSASACLRIWRRTPALRAAEERRREMRRSRGSNWRRDSTSSSWENVSSEIEEPEAIFVVPMAPAAELLAGEVGASSSEEDQLKEESEEMRFDFGRESVGKEVLDS
jgi:hypothetical protein